MSGRAIEVLVTYGDECLGVVGPFHADSPWWADVEPVAGHVRTVLGVPAVVLRLVDVVGGVSPRGGHVTYHAEASSRLDVVLPHPATHDCDSLRRPEPHRSPWATPDGVAAALAWAQTQLAVAPAGSGRHLVVASDGSGPASALSVSVEQVKSWNLSALFRITTGGASGTGTTGTGTAWLKLTPAFAAFEPDVFAVVAQADATLVPTVLAADRAHRRMLLAHVPGQDCWDASPELIRATVTRWVAAQAAVAGTAMVGIPDGRPARLPDGLRRLLDGAAGRQLDAAERDDAQGLADRLPGLIGELAACGLPETLVHGDFHPGNWRSDGRRTTVFDFADAYVGHPAFDGERLREFVGPDRDGPVVEAWCAAWREHRPDADPARALALARPLQAVSGAVTYQMFLDNIEPSERRYHETDPVTGIRDALAAMRGLAH
jgi:Phosphotransferase enzyme family